MDAIGCQGVAAETQDIVRKRREAGKGRAAGTIKGLEEGAFTGDGDFALAMIDGAQQLARRFIIFADFNADGALGRWRAA